MSPDEAAAQIAAILRTVVDPSLGRYEGDTCSQFDTVRSVVRDALSQVGIDSEASLHGCPLCCS